MNNYSIKPLPHLIPFIALLLGHLLLLSGCGTLSRNSSARRVSRPEGARKSYIRYIQEYTPYALKSQSKFGIPVAITLAQGLLESGAGNSILARDANNHFGIKCHNAWRGDRIFHTDDAPDECFRAYDTAQDSFDDHAQYLSSQKRYQSLFGINPSNYKAWARGLQKAGYATDKEYANKLIKIIEDYQLHRISDGNIPSEYAYDTPRDNPRKTPTSLKRELLTGYGLLYVIAKENDDIATIARELGVNEKDLLEYNDYPTGYPLQKGDIIYLQMKLKRAMPPHYEHVIKVGESMHSIAQLYGIQLKALYEMNHLNEEYTPQVGDLLRLR